LCFAAVSEVRFFPAGRGRAPQFLSGRGFPASADIVSIHSTTGLSCKMRFCDGLPFLLAFSMKSQPPGAPRNILISAVMTIHRMRLF
jgi:hypothetical protein